MGINVLEPAITALYHRCLVDKPALWRRRWEPAKARYAPAPDGWIDMGVVIESFDQLRVFHKKTMNRELSYNGAVRFDLVLDRPAVRSALLVYTVSSRPAPPNAANHSICCNARSQVSLVSRLVGPIRFSVDIEVQSHGTRTDYKRFRPMNEVGVTTDIAYRRIADTVEPPDSAETEGGTSMTGFDVTGIVRDWLAHPATNFGFFLHAGIPDIRDYPYGRVFRSLGPGNFRRRKHWVRQEEFEIGDGQYRFVCLSHVAPYLIVET